MSDSSQYTLKTAEVHLSTGVNIVAEVASFEAIKRLVQDAEASQLGGLIQDSAKSRETPPVAAAHAPEDPLARMETRAGLKAGSLAKAKLVAVKDEAPHLLRPHSFKKIIDAVVVLIFAVETGMRRNPIDYDSFSALYEAQNLKSGTPLAMMLTNLRNGGYLDKRTYADRRNLRLTGKGEEKAVQVLKELCDAA
ncbi:MAG: hypothetical protein DMD55_19925 [Gemmatimonadetes bacterium]|nr:MAG: hypothetical protein DMD55_19925 [Gemmatimonadota bacterium]